MAGDVKRRTLKWVRPWERCDDCQMRQLFVIRVQPFKEEPMDLCYRCWKVFKKAQDQEKQPEPPQQTELWF